MNKYKTAIEKFYQIRDLPYHIATKGEPGCDCEDKAKMLVKELVNLGIDARFRIGLFDWSVIDFPKEVTSISHDKKCSHCFVEVKNSDSEWIFVDPTWNQELKRAGFEIAEWDGNKPTCLAMKCEKILSPEESIRYMEKIDYETDLQDNGKFYEAINKFCDGLLSKS